MMNTIMTPMHRIGRWGRVSLTLLGLSLAPALLGTGCGGEAPTPPAGSEKYEAERQAYRAARGKEYGRKSIEPGENQAKGTAAGKKGRSR